MIPTISLRPFISDQQEKPQHELVGIEAALPGEVRERQRRKIAGNEGLLR